MEYKGKHLYIAEKLHTGYDQKPNPRSSAYCGSCRDVRFATLNKSPFGSDTYLNTKGKEVLPLQAECRTCGSGWPVYLVGDTLHRKAPQRQAPQNPFN